MCIYMHVSKYFEYTEHKDYYTLFPECVLIIKRVENIKRHNGQMQLKMWTS